MSFLTLARLACLISCSDIFSGVKVIFILFLKFLLFLFRLFFLCVGLLFVGVILLGPLRS